MTKEQELKEHAILALNRRVESQYDQLEIIDDRILEYFLDLCNNSGTANDDPHDHHNVYELLGALKFLRLLRTYDFDVDDVQDAIYDGEGEWRLDDDGFWTHVDGGLKQPGRTEPQVYRWEPFQVFGLACMYGPRAWIPTGNKSTERRPAETERVNTETGEIEDYRRLCTRFILYGPRKINKSGYSAIAAVRDFMKGDFDAQTICVANSLEQSKILFSKARDILLQLDPVKGSRFNGKFLSYSATEVKFQKGAWRQATLQAIPAGGKLPDGKFASFCAPDEIGSAAYVNGRSDMGQTMAVIESSMGPRREPLTLMTTTASLIAAGPFTEILDSTHRALERELLYDTGEAEPTLAEDRQMCLLLEPDAWQRDDETLLTSKAVRKKVNPMLGKIVQHSFYDDEVAKSRMDETKKKETISKLFNVYQLGAVSEWVKPDRIRELQRPRRIEDCQDTDGWDVYCGMDFSQGNDLHAATYLAVRWNRELGAWEYFADMDAWINEETLQSSSIRDLYEKWIEQGWLHLSEGGVFQPNLLVKRIRELNDVHMINFMAFGYDSHLSHDPINELSSWLQTIGVADPSKIAVPVSQTNATFNQSVDRLTFLLKDKDTTLSFSENPLWPWQFGNAVLDEDTRMQNRKPIKRNPSIDSCKVDNVQCLCMAFILEEQFNV